VLSKKCNRFAIEKLSVFKNASIQLINPLDFFYDINIRRTKTCPEGMQFILWRVARE